MQYTGQTIEEQRYLPRGPNDEGMYDANFVNTVFIPYWVKQALDRNKYNYMDMLDYDKIRQILSIEDMAQLVFSNSFDKHPVLSKFESYYTLQRYWKKKTDGTDNAELNAIIQPLSESSSMATAVKDRFIVPNNENSYLAPNEVLKFHEVQVSKERVVFIHLNKGLLNALEDRAYVKTFVSDYLKALYSLIPIRDVSFRPVFDVYVESL